MDDRMIRCPSCGGEAMHTVFADGHDDAGVPWGGLRTVRCLVCKGAGMITEAHLERVEAGKVLRQARIAQGITLMQAAEYEGTTPAAVSARERGD